MSKGYGTPLVVSWSVECDEMAPPAWLMLGLLLSFMEALWMGMVLDGHHNNDNNGCDDTDTMTTTSNHSSSSSISTAFSCNNDQVIFVGLDLAEPSIVGTVAMNLKKACGNDKHVLFTQQPLSSILPSTPNSKAHPPRLVSFLRQPAKRAEAEFFRWISIYRLEPTDKRFRSFFLDEPHLDHYYLRHLSVQPITANDTKSYTARVSLRTEILNRYDFLGTTERMMESLVVLKMKWSLSWNDILHLSPYPSFFLDHSNGTQCVYQVPYFTNQDRESLLDNARWKRRISGDMALYAAVNARLDSTIDLLGYDEVMAQLQTFHKLLRGAIDKCWTSTAFPCSANGDLALHNHTCVVDELGCGHECLTSNFS